MCGHPPPRTIPDPVRAHRGDWVPDLIDDEQPQPGHSEGELQQIQRRSSLALGAAH
jgi:hypothetical protein